MQYYLLFQASTGGLGTHCLWVSWELLYNLQKPNSSKNCKMWLFNLLNSIEYSTEIKV